MKPVSLIRLMDFNFLADLGEWWEEDTGLPIPLGSIIARRTLDVKSIARLDTGFGGICLDPSGSIPGIYDAACPRNGSGSGQEHIDLYVNEFTADLGEEGYNAIYALLSRAAKEGIVPEIKPEMLR